MTTDIKFHTLLFTLCLVLTGGALPVFAQAPQTERVSFDPGTNGTVIKDGIQGNEIIDYVLGAKAGQRMMVVLETDNSANYFNVMEPGSTGEAMYIGSTEGNRFEGGLPVDGDYTIRVYLMRSAARRNETADYSLAVNIFGPGAGVEAPDNDFADGLGGGPDFWEVTGVGSGDLLNMRAGPSTGNEVIGQFANGDVLRNLGCKMEGGQRWCKVILAAAENDPEGWVAGRYLRESGGPSMDTGASSQDTFGQTPSALADLVGARAGQAEGVLTERGYEFRSASKSADSSYTNWEELSTGECVTIRTSDGRYQSIIYGSRMDCAGEEVEAPSVDATVSVDVPVGNGQPFHAAGEVPCSISAGQPTGSCKFGVIREKPGFAGVWIDRQGRGERYFLFENGEPVYSDGGDLSYEKSADLYLIRTGDGERYEIFEAVIYGG